MTRSDHNPCAACAACCRTYIVPISGYDLWLISTEQRLDPEQFLMIYTYPPENTATDGFSLESGGPLLGLALDKQGRFKPKQPCVFLMRLADGSERCGIYDHRPGVCRTYPMAIWGQSVFMRKDAICPPNAWSPSQLRRPAWREALQRFFMRNDIYHEVVARWNARVASSPEGTRFTLHEYLSYLMNVYDRLSHLERETREDQLARIQTDWPTLPRPTGESVEQPLVEGKVPWLDFLLHSRQIIDSFYPRVPALPLLIFEPMNWPEAGDTGAYR